MSDPIKLLKQFGYDVELATPRIVLMIREAIEDNRLGHSDMIQHMSLLIDDKVRIDDQNSAEMTYKYFIVGLIEGFKSDSIPNVEQCFLQSHTKAQNFISKNPWVFAKSEKEESEKKRSKLDIAKELYEQNRDMERKDIIEMFIMHEELKMSKAQARTYYRMITADQK